jgi:hypothetical protein
MKKAFSLILLLATTTPAFAQGRLQFDIDQNHLIYFPADMSMLKVADWCKTADNGGGAGPFPIEGSGLYTGPGSTIAALSGSPSFVAALYGGATAFSLTLQATTTIGDANLEGSVAPVNCTFASLAADTPAYFLVQVYDSRANSAADAWNQGFYAGESQVFSATPSSTAYLPIYLAGPPVNSTWAPGTRAVADMTAAYGPGFYGAIEVSGSLGGIIPQSPYISTQPKSTTNHWGESATFSVAASGPAAPNYQWQENGTNLSDGPHISGSATPQLILRAITFADAGSYRVIVFNCLGSAISSNAILTVLEGLSITEQPRSQVGYSGKSVNFNVTASGSPLPSYQWQKDGAAIAGATDSSLVLTNLQTTNAGRYTVLVTNSFASLTSSNAYLSVNPPGVSLVTYPGLTIGGVAGSTYGIQYNASLTKSTGWQGMTNLSLDVPTALWFDVQPATQQQRFYRVVPGPIPVP